MSEAAQTAQLEFLTKLQRILGEGQFVASYKYALLLTLAELSVEKSIQPDGSLAKVAARYSFLYQYRNGAWQIVHHHSAVLPEAN